VKTATLLAAAIGVAWTLALGPASPQTATPQPAGPQPAGSMVPDRPAQSDGTWRTRFWCDHREALTGAALAFLRLELGIDSGQAPAWTRFTEVVRRSEAPLARLCAEHAGQGLPPTTLPELLERKERSTQAFLEAMQSLRLGIQDLYASLTPQQKQALDGLPQILLQSGVLHGSSR